MSLHDHTMHQASGSASDHRGRQSARLRYKHLAFGVGLALGSLLVCGVASAASGVSATESPTGGKVIGGAGSITQHGAETIVKQQSKLLALDWQTFNVGKDASVLFDQPSFNAVALNRILDQSPSQIFGKISSNGQIFLINTHGIIFGSTAQLNVGGLVASTLDLTPDDFLSRHFSLDAHGGHAGIVNHGTIAAARGGSISLIGGNVQNSGLIVADYGRINLDGADKAVLDFDGDGLINVQITGALQKRFDSEQAAVANKGTLKSTSGNVVLQASAAKDLFTNLVNNSGVIDAHGISTDGGVVRLVGHGGNTVSSGSIDVSGVHGGGAQLLSDHDVTVTGSVVASGASGGGSIRVGGGARGGEGLLRATNTTIGSGAVLDADATQNGNGGSIAVWGNDHADVAGVLSARGGAQGGHGGAIETSAEHVYIADGTRVNTLAARGASGTWLIDPQDFTVAASGGDITGAQLGTNLGTSSVTILSSTGGTGGSGNINVNDAVNWSANTLTLTAANDVNINAVMTASGTAGLALNPATANGADGAVAGGTVNVMPGSGRVDFTGTGNSLSIGGTSYTIITSLGASNSTTKADLQGIDGDLTGHYALGADIDATATSGWGGGKGFKPLGDDTTNFSGVFDGLGHTISNLNINTSSSYAGLFGAVGSGGTVRNVGLVGGSVASSAGSAAVSRAYVGSLTGFNLGTVSNVFAGTLVSDGQGYTNVGGLVGYNTGTIKQAYATGAVNGGGSYTGGLVGLNNGGSITDAYATGAVAGANAVGGLVGGSVGTITDAYATGTVSGGSVGGLVGVDGGGTVTNGYWDVQTTGVASSGGGTALTTAQLQSGLPAGFSNSTWSIVAGASFPYLSSQFAPGATPVAVSGTVFTDAGTTVAGGVTVNALNSGNALGATTTYGNGYFYYLFDPSVLSGSNVLVYAENYGSGGAINGAGFADGYATLPALDIFGNTLNVYTGATAWSTVLADLAGTEGGGATAATALTTGLPVTGLASLGVAAQGALGFDAALDWGGNLGVTAQGAITQTGTGNLTISGSSDLDAGTGAITLANTGNDFVGGVTAAGTGVALTDANSLTIVSLDGGTGDVTLDASGGTLSVNGAVSGKNVSLSGSSGISLAGNVSSSGTQAYNDAVALGANVTASSSGSGNIDFASTVDGAHALAVNTGGATTFGGAVGGTTALTSLTTNAGGSTTLDGNVSTTGAQTYNDAVNLGGDASLASSGSGNIEFASSVDGAHNLAVNTGGQTAFGTVGGTTALTSLTTDAGGTTALNGNVSTTGAQTYNDAVTLGADAIAASSGGGTISFNSTVDGGYALTVDTGGAAVFGGAVGGTMKLAGLDSDSSTFSANALQVVGDLSVTTTSGGISQGGAWGVGGASNFDAGTNAITLANAGNDFTGAVSLTGGTVQITDTNALALGTLSTGTLTATSTGALNLGSGTVNGNLGATSNGGAISQSGALTVTGSSSLDAGGGSVTLANANNDFQGAVTASGAGVELTDVNDLNIASLTNSGNGDVSLIAGGALFGVGAIDAGTGNITLAANGGALNTATLTGGDITLTGAGGIVLGSNVTAGGALSLTSGSTVSQNLGTVITADSLTGSSVGSTILEGNNAIGSLSDFTAAGFSLTSGQALTVATGAVVDGGASTTLTTTGAGSDLTLDGIVRGTTTELTSSGTITQGSAGIIDAGTLTGSSAGDTTLGGANQIDTVAQFGADDFTLVNAAALTVQGPLVTTGNISLTTTGPGNVLSVGQALTGGMISLDSAGDLSVVQAIQGTTINLAANGNLAIDAAINSGSGVTTLVQNGASGTISQSGAGTITAGTLTGAAQGSVALTGANAIATLGDFSAEGFSLTNAGALTVAAGSTVDGGDSTVLKTGGDLTIDGNVAGTLTSLVSSGAINEGSAGTITAGILTGSAAHAAQLTGHNAIDNIGNFKANGLALTNGQALTVLAGATVDGGANAALTITGTGGNLSINGTLKATTTKLLASGAIGEGVQGSLQAGTLTGGSTGSTSLTSANNAVANLGNFTANGFALTSGQALTIAAGSTLDGKASTTLTTTGAGHDLGIDGTVKGGLVTLVSSGAIGEGAGGRVQAGGLTGSSVGDTKLTQTGIDELNAFNAKNFYLTNAKALAVGGPVTTTGNAGDISLATSGTGNALTVNQAVKGAVITLASAGDLTVANAVTGTAVNLAASGNLLIDAAVDSGAGTTTLAQTGGGAITSGANGSITAATLTGSATGATTLGSAGQFMGNHVGILGGFSSPAGFSLTNDATLTLASVNGSAFTVDAGTSNLYLAVHNGDLLQTGTSWAYDGTGTWSASGHIGLANAPIYVTGTSPQIVAAIGLPPAYFYAVDYNGNLLPLTGATSVNVPTSILSSRSQGVNGHSDQYIDVGVITATYRAYGVVPPGLLLPPDQQQCSPDQPSPECPDNN